MHRSCSVENGCGDGFAQTPQEATVNAHSNPNRLVVEANDFFVVMVQLEAWS